MKKLTPPCDEMTTRSPATTLFRTVTPATTSTTGMRKTATARREGRRASAHSASAAAKSNRLGRARTAMPKNIPAAAAAQGHRRPPSSATANKKSAAATRNSANDAGNICVSKKAAGKYTTQMTPATTAAARPYSRRASANIKAAVSAPSTSWTKMTA